MGHLLRILEPRSKMGVLLRSIIFISLIGLANIAFAAFYDGRMMQDPGYYITHAIFVGGPFVAFFYFIALQQIKLQRKLSHLSRKDELTGLNNRRTFFQMTQWRQQQTKGGALLLLDADNFKKINDTYGHKAGDICLKSIAYMLQRNLREDDVVGRVGGEEFAIFLSNANVQQARVIGQRLTQPIPFVAGPLDAHLTVTLSVGAVMACSDNSLDSLFIKADEALYRAKADGRARMVLWENLTENKCQSEMSSGLQ